MLKFSTIVFIGLSTLCHGQQSWREIPLQHLESNITQIQLTENGTVVELNQTTGDSYRYNGQIFTPSNDHIHFQREYVDSLGIGPISKIISYEDSELIATINNGLWLRKGQTTKQFLAEGVDFPSGVIDMDKYEDSYIFLSNKNTLLQWNPSSYDLIEIEIPVGEYITDIEVDNWGQVWLLSEDALFSRQQWPSKKGPIISFSTAEYKFGPIDTSAEKIEFDNEELVLSFGASSTYLKNDKLEYLYRLKNTGDWFPLEGNRINITNLAPGEYAFQFGAKAGNSDLSYSETLEFEVKQHFWNTFWPWLFGGIGTLLLFWWISFRRQQQELSIIKNSANKYRLENQLLKSKQETKQLQMNPHFLFNSLNTIKGLISQNENKKARAVLTDYASMMRSLLDQSREDKISIEQEIQFLTKYLQLEKTARNDSFDFNIEVGNNLDLEIAVPPMILQPIVENSVIHGMRGLNRKGKIDLLFEENEEDIIVIIDDNGVGRQSTTSNNHESHGTTILIERLQNYLPLSKKAIIKYIDKQENSEAIGTKVTIHLPKLN